MSMTGLQRELHGQWLNMPLYHGIVDLFFPLAAEASLGKYTINMPGLKNTFSVEEYVLPKFSVSIRMPPVITILEEKFHLQVGGMYTYGKPVQGKVQAMVCHKPICYS
ncbi:alpha-2-macroglobulin-like isoform X1 [Mauremys reevesii]|uniref:alpha-2-macroglobulin-like isoform X1 n=1 Tax=Mauremys reevesii TaxID=260615 RepID=UPI00193F8DE5|nr:alpha-2-macroglobulin-like isoform X1 [Mauremys reevesii]